MFVGDLHARLFFTTLIYLINGTRSPDEIAEGYMRHRWSADWPCAWNPDRQAKKWYDWAGWGEYAKTHACHIPVFGWPNLHNVTLAKASSWWGKGDARDVMTMLQKENPRHASFVYEDTTLSYVWRSVIRTGGSGLFGSYTKQHPRVMDRVVKLLGRGPPTLIVVAMYAFDAQWQNADEINLRMRGLFRGLNVNYPEALKLTLGPSSCQDKRPYSVYMSSRTGHNIFHNVENASALAPYARAAAENMSVLFLDTLPSKRAFTPTRLAPCHYDLPFGPMSEGLVQIALNSLF